MDLFDRSSTNLMTVCAPMVRYSRLPFRTLVREYDCQLAYSPMIMADNFVKAEKYRQIEFDFGTKQDNPVIAQFAAKTPDEFADASEYIYRHCAGIDLNCGCPQRWAIQEGIGACMLNRPEVVADILRQTRNRIPDSAFHVSVKVRVFADLTKTVDLVRQLESAGISFITVHGRTIKERSSQPVNLEAIKTVVDSLSIPVIANGDIDSLKKAQAVQDITGVKGVMSARGLLSNPALFSGYEKTPISAVKRWIEINIQLNCRFMMFHRHLMHMTESILTKAERKVFNALTTKQDVISYLCDRFGFTLSDYDPNNDNITLGDEEENSEQL